MAVRMDVQTAVVRKSTCKLNLDREESCGWTGRCMAVRMDVQTAVVRKSTTKQCSELVVLSGLQDTIDIVLLNTIGDRNRSIGGLRSSAKVPHPSVKKGRRLCIILENCYSVVRMEL